MDVHSLSVLLCTYNRAGLPQVDWLIKWNPRKTNVAEWAARRDADPATR